MAETQKVTMEWSKDHVEMRFDPPIPFLEAAPVDNAFMRFKTAVEAAKKRAQRKRREYRTTLISHRATPRKVQPRG